MNGTETSVFDTFSEHFGYPYLLSSPVTLVRVMVKIPCTMVYGSAGNSITVIKL